jgi:hypothetical protein
MNYALENHGKIAPADGGSIEKERRVQAAGELRSLHSPVVGTSHF